MKDTNKIGILTFSHSRNMNYGAMLQSYALYKMIECLGYNPQIINWDIKKKTVYSLIDIKETSKIGYFKAVLKRIIGVTFLPFVRFLALKIGESPFRLFSQQFLPNKTFRVDKKNIADLNSLLDAFVVGSDQVWRYKNNADISTFFLNFVDDDKLKISYAASFGIDKWNEAPPDITEEVTKLLSRFDFVSVREEAGVKICSSIFKTTAVRVLDPSLLLGKSDYLQLMRQQDSAPVNHTGYFATMLIDNINNQSFNDRLSAITRQQIIDIKGKGIKLFGKVFIKYNSVSTWLELIYNADFIITDSFHCAAFCLIFEKPFAVIANERRGISRLENFLSLFNIKELLFKNKEEFLSSHLWQSKIDYNNIRKILVEEREKSISFLIKALNE